MSTAPRNTAPRNKVVLAVDDSAEDLALLNAFIMGAGYAFVGASSGEDCLSLIHRCPPRLILLDIQMTGLDGFETCRRLRENLQLKTVPIAFLTARHTRADVREGLSAGGNDFIAKPIDRAMLLQRIHYWANHRAGAAKAA
jgi:DNA-binding response OmpR family regulator